MISAWLKLIYSVMPYFTLLFSFIFFLISTGCGGGRGDNSAKGGMRPKYVPLSIEDSKKLITPTVYFVPQYGQPNAGCPQTVDMKARSGLVIVAVCKSVYDSCVLQGTCLIKSAEKFLLINVGVKINGERRFEVVDRSRCSYGRGAVRDLVKVHPTMCLDPYFSVAADLKIYKLGDVIFVPSFSGVLLSDGTVHDGHFIVRDTGGSMTGHGRFDFFSGFDSPKESSNPLVFHQFVDRRTHVPYFLVSGQRAQEILIQRNFPRLPVLK